MVHPWPREQFPPRLQHGWQERVPSVEQPQDDGRYAEMPSQDARGPPMSIEKALRDHCNIKARHYFLSVVLDDGTTHTFAGPRLNPGVINRFFDMDRFVHYAQKAESGETGAMFGDVEYEMEGPYRRDFSGRSRVSDRRRATAMPMDAYEGDTIPKARMKRPRNEADTCTPVTISRKRPIKVGDSDMMWNFYQQRFKNCQQSACKLIAKAWVKAVEPKKQSHHPYTGKDEKAPDWWPKPWGQTKDEKVRHKEPDHLYKKERVHLLTHILRLVVQPEHKQHPEVQKSCLNVSKLEEVTNEALSSFFTDANNPNNCLKRPYLQEIFKVARQEERYLNGEIDAETNVYVMADDKIPDSYQSDADAGVNSRDDDDQDPKSETPSVSSCKPAQSHSVVPTTGAGDIPQSFMAEPLPVRGGPLSHQMVHAPELGAEQQSYMEGGGLGVGTASLPHGHGPSMAIMTDAHDNGRRPSMMFNPPADYPNSAGTGMYPQQWQPTSTSAGASAMYSTFAHPQPAPAQSPFGNQANMPLQQGQHYLAPPTFDGLPRAAFDPNQGNLFRQGGVGQSPVSHHHHAYDALPR